MFSMSMTPDMEMRVTPALLNLAQLLSLPSMDLQQLVQQEIGENPALEEIEAYEQSCDRCGSLVIEGICIVCANTESVGDGPARNEEAIDPLLFVAAPRSLSETLLSDLHAGLPESAYPIALAVVGSLDERGFLADDPEEIAERSGGTLEDIQIVLRLLREIGPPGIASRNSQECMLAQIDALAAQGISHPHVRTVIADYFEDLGLGRFKQIARRLRINAQEMNDIRAFIKRHLWPYPAQATGSEAAPMQRTRYRTADIAILHRDDQFIVEVMHSPRRVLRLNPLYQQLARTTTALPDEEREHVREYIARARVFLTNLRQRESTLKRIGEAIVDRQAGFLLHGVRHLQPMTRAEIAIEIGVHESTISRATSDKTALLPNGTLLPMSEFFVAARGVQDVLRELIAGEKSPLSDDELARMLGEQGYPIARRTVAKYRNLLHIPPSHLR